MRGDYDAGYRAVSADPGPGRGSRLRAGHLPGRFLYSVLCCWFEPRRNDSPGKVGKPGTDDRRVATWPTRDTTWQSNRGSAAGLRAHRWDTFVAEVEAGRTFARRTGSEQSVPVGSKPNRWLAGVMRGDVRSR